MKRNQEINELLEKERTKINLEKIKAGFCPSCNNEISSKETLCNKCKYKLKESTQFEQRMISGVKIPETSTSVFSIPSEESETRQLLVKLEKEGYLIHPEITKLIEKGRKVWELEVGGKNLKNLKIDLKAVMKNHYNDHFEFILKEMSKRKGFIRRQKNPEKIYLIALTVSDLGLSGSEDWHYHREKLTTDKIYSRAIKYGLDLCHPEVGPYHRIKTINQFPNENYRIAMKEMYWCHQNEVFEFRNGEIDTTYYDLGLDYESKDKFVFCLQKLQDRKTQTLRLHYESE